VGENPSGIEPSVAGHDTVHQNFMKKLLSLCAALTISVTAVYFCAGCCSTVSVQHSGNMASPRNDMERYAQSLVLVEDLNGDPLGSGIIVIREQRIFAWTAAHVVDGENLVSVTSDDKKFKATVIFRDRYYDVALLRIDGAPEHFYGAHFANNRPPSRGSKIYHAGNIQGKAFANSITVGVVAGYNAGVGTPSFPWHVVDYGTAAVYKGSSGGPIFSSGSNKVIGMAVGLGFNVSIYVPVRVLRSLVPWAVDGTFCPSEHTLTAMELTAHTHRWD